MPPNPDILDHIMSHSIDFGTLDALTRTCHAARETFLAHRFALLRAVGERVFGPALPAALRLVYATRVAVTSSRATMTAALPTEDDLLNLGPAFADLTPSLLHRLAETAKKLERAYCQRCDSSTRERADIPK
jgi:hypothetical protein